MKPKLRCYYWGEQRALVNLGDLLVPTLLDAFGYACTPRATPDSEVHNPGRCLLVIGSLLTQRDLQQLAYPVDVWGCGWKGPDQAPSGHEDMRIFAVRGPHTQSGLALPAELPLGDPALLMPQVLPMVDPPHGQAVVLPHFSRLTTVSARSRCASTGCTEMLSPLVLRAPPSPRLWARLLWQRWRLGIQTRDLQQTLRRLAGARFVLTGSLHGAILAQAYGVPWACYHDGYLDAPAKWNDWGAYLDIDIEMVSTLAEGERWWHKHGSRGRIRDLAPLLAAFPYPIRTPGSQ